jgi:hypothetical protein
MGPTLGVLAHNVPTQDDSMQRDRGARRSTTPPSADAPSASPERGQHTDSGILENWTIRSKPPAPLSEPPDGALTDAESLRRRRQWLVLTGVCIFAVLIFSLALLRALLG